MTRKIFGVLILCILASTGYTQGEPVSTKNFHSYSSALEFGCTNLTDLARDVDFGPVIYIDYTENKDSILEYHGGIQFGVRRTDLGNIQQTDFSPAVIYLGLRKNWIRHRSYFHAGIDIYYNNVLRHTRLSGFTSDEMGLGVALNCGFNYLLREDLALTFQMTGGVGVYRVFRQVGNVTAVSIAGRANVFKYPSIGIKQKF